MILHPRSEPSTSQIERRWTRGPAPVWLTVAFATALVACGSTSQKPIPTQSPAEAQAPAIEEPVATPPKAEEGRQPPAEASGDPAAFSPADTSDNQSSSSAPAELGEVDYSDTVWAPGDEGVLMKGLDGGLYQPYLASVIKQVQTELKPEFYNGPATGVLDEETMRAIGEFQKQNDLQVSGVPSPYTREKLFQERDATST